MKPQLSLNLGVQATPAGSPVRMAPSSIPNAPAAFTEEWYVVRVASKLFNDGLTTENYTSPKAIAVLNNTVAPTFNISLLAKYEAQVLQLISKFQVTV